MPTAHPAVRNESTRWGSSCSAGNDPAVTMRTWSAATANGSDGEPAERRPASTTHTVPPGSLPITPASGPPAWTSAECVCSADAGAGMANQSPTAAAPPSTSSSAVNEVVLVARTTAIRPGSTPMPSSAPRRPPSGSASTTTRRRPGSGQAAARPIARLVAPGDPVIEPTTTSVTRHHRSGRHAGCRPPRRATPSSRRAGHAHRHPQLPGGDRLDGPHGAGAERARLGAACRCAGRRGAATDSSSIGAPTSRPDSGASPGSSAAPRTISSAPRGTSTANMPGVSIVPAGMRPIGNWPIRSAATADDIDATSSPAATRPMRRSPRPTGWPGCRSVVAMSTSARSSLEVNSSTPPSELSTTSRMPATSHAGLR